MKHVFVSLILLVLSVGAAQEAAPLEVLEETSEYRLVRHPGGETRVPADPQRVAILHPSFSDTAVALGVEPVGVAHWEGSDSVGGYLPHLANELEGTPLIGTGYEANLEAVLATSPDLIIAGSWNSDIFAQLSRVAPTVLLDSEDDWKREFLAFGRVLGRQAEAEAFLETYEAKAAEASARLAEIVGDESVMVLAPYRKELRVYGDRRQFGRVLYRDLGLTPPEGALLEDENINMISEEVLPELDPDHLFLIVLDEEEEAAVAELSRSGLWQNLSAVESGNVYTVPWTFNLHAPLVNSMVLDAALEHLTAEGE